MATPVALAQCRTYDEAQVRAAMEKLLGALGGMGTLGLVPFFCGFGDGAAFIARGIAEQVRLRLIEGTPHMRNPQPDWLRFWPSIDPERLKRIYDDLVTAAGADVLFHTALVGVERGAGGAEALLVANKTGGVNGTSNDAAIVFTPTGAPLVMVVFWKGLGCEAKGKAAEAIAEVANVLYTHLGEPA